MPMQKFSNPVLPIVLESIYSSVFPMPAVAPSKTTLWTNHAFVQNFTLSNDRTFTCFENKSTKGIRHQLQKRLTKSLK